MTAPSPSIGTLRSSLHDVLHLLLRLELKVSRGWTGKSPSALSGKLLALYELAIALRDDLDLPPGMETVGIQLLRARMNSLEVRIAALPPPGIETPASPSTITPTSPPAT